MTVVGFWLTGPLKGLFEELDPALGSPYGSGLFKISGMNGPDGVVQIDEASVKAPVIITTSSLGLWFQATGRLDDMLIWDRNMITWAPGVVEDNGHDLRGEHFYGGTGPVSGKMDLYREGVVVATGDFAAVLADIVPSSIGIVVFLRSSLPGLMNVGIRVNPSLALVGVRYDNVRVEWEPGVWTDHGLDVEPMHVYTTEGTRTVTMRLMWTGMVNRFGSVDVNVEILPEEPEADPVEELTILHTHVGRWVRVTVDGTPPDHTRVEVLWDGVPMDVGTDLSPEFVFAGYGPHIVRVNLYNGDVLVGQGSTTVHLAVAPVMSLELTAAVEYQRVVLGVVDRPEYYDALQVNWGDGAGFEQAHLDFTPEHVYANAGTYAAEMQILWRQQIVAFGSMVVETTVEQDDPPVDPEE